MAQSIVGSTSPAGLVLVIDQSSDQDPFVIQSIKSQGYRVHSTHKGDQGLEFWRTHHPEVVICEMSDQAQDGMDVLEQIASSKLGTQVIVISAAGNTELVVAALRLGAADFLIKPISDREVLLHSVKRAFEEHQLVVENRLYRQALEKKNQELKESLRLLKEDQEAGRAVQVKLLPDAEGAFGPVQIAYKILPSLYLSGDFVDYFDLGPHQIGFYLADVSGHGASSAFITLLLKTVANRVRHRCYGAVDNSRFPEYILRAANDELLPLGLGKHLAVFCGLIDLKTKRLTYCSAAHFPPPVLATAGELMELEGRGLPVGLFEKVEFDRHEVILGERFELLLFSDGILELMTQQSVAEKERYLVEIVGKGIHNIDQILDHLEIDPQQSVPDDVAIMSILGTTL